MTDKNLDEQEGSILITGDFNGHMYIRGRQKVNENGKMILDWMDKYNLILLNEDQKCEGTYTWKKKCD